MDELLTKIGLSLTFDTAIIGFLVISAFFYGITVGRKKVLIMLVGTYVAYSLFSTTPFLDELDLENDKRSLLKISVFVAYTVFAYLLLSGTKIGNLFHFSRMQGMKHWWQILIIGILQIGLWVSIVLTLFPETITLKIAPITELLFTKEKVLFFWFLAPIIFLAIIRKKRTRESTRENEED